VVKGNKLIRGPIERAILENRDSINTALAHVLSSFLIIHPMSTPNPIPDFAEHFAVLCNLLRAYSSVAGKPDEWSEDIIQSWDKLLSTQETDEDTLERPLLRIFRNLTPDDPDIKTTNVCYSGKSGKLYITESGALLSRLQELNLPESIRLPRNATGLRRRLWTTNFISFQVLDEKRAPDLDVLKRSAKRRLIGIFFSDDSGDA
jgi:hypothetical protein